MARSWEDNLAVTRQDEPSFYWNNWGSIELTVTLLPGE